MNNQNELSKSNNQYLLVKNRNSRWQYLVILVSLIFLTLSALPNVFEKQVVIVMTSQNTQSTPFNSPKLNDPNKSDFYDVQQVREKLLSQGYSVKSISADLDAIEIELRESEKVEPAVELLRSYNPNYRYTVENREGTPQWLRPITGESIKLGLDLSGGVLLILQVDSEQAFAEKMEFIKQNIQANMRTQLLRDVQVKKVSENTIEVISANQLSLSKALQDLDQLFPELIQERVSDKQLTLVYPEKALHQYHQEIMQQSLTVLRGRIEELGITEAVTQRQGSNKIRIELPGLSDPDEAKRIIGATASLSFYQTQEFGGSVFSSDTGVKTRVNPVPIFTGKNIKNAQSGRDEMGSALVHITLDSEGGDKMLRFTSKNIGNPMVTVFSEYYQPEKTTKNEKKTSQFTTLKQSKVISVATIQAQLGRQFSITNLGSHQEANELALLLRAGSLEAPISIVTQRVIGATLGESNIQNGIAALMLGVGLTVLFMTLWYRKLGLIANVSLLLNLVCLLGLMSLLPGAVLTLPGIAGLVLTVGMAVDTNVLIFERIKEERLRGRSLPVAVNNGYQNAFATILDANVTTLITAIILYSIGYGPVKGFALTLSLGILTSLFTGVFISRALTNIFYLKSQSDRKNRQQSNIKTGLETNQPISRRGV